MALPTKIDYTIIVPSRRRPHTMDQMRYLVPTSKICIDEREVGDYAPFVEKSRMLVHPSFDGLPKVLNWCIQTVQSEVLIFLDDDLQGVQVNVGNKRFLTDSDEILAVIENSMRCCKDLGLTTFCWSRTPNMTVINPSTRPIVPVQLVTAAFGIMGGARRQNFEEEFTARSCIDWTLRTLLKDRAVFADVRFYFDFGRPFAGAGGNVGLVTPDSFKAISLSIQKRWGRHVSFKPPAFAKKKRDIATVKIAVSRTNKTAQR